MTISFSYFYMDYYDDYVYIYDGYNSSSSLIASLTGYISSSSSYTTSQRYMFVLLVSKGLWTYTGFDANYTINPTPGFSVVLCCFAE